MSNPNRNEATTRKELIDPALKKVGWDINNPEQVRTEIPVDGFDTKAWENVKHILEAGGIYEGNLPKGVSDYALYRPNGEIIAVVEAKRTSIDPRLAQTQAEFYITQLEKLQGFRQHKLTLYQSSINTAITDRLYQQEAIRRVCETFEQHNKRKALLVMATGTGKTRTVMSVIDVFLRSNQARHILFVADRDALVRQAISDGFKKFLPNEPCERIYTHALHTTSRLYAVTLQTGC